MTAFPIMFTLMFTYLFGGALAGSTGEYLQFLLPGILVQTVVFITMYTGMGLNTDITKGVFDRFRSLPVWRPAALVGALLGDAARYAMASTMVIVLGLILGYRPEGGVAGVLLAVALLLVFSFGLSWIWTALGLILRTPNSVMMASFFILFPLTFASNIFVDPKTMPGWLETVVGVNPITHLVTAVRGLMHGSVTTGQIGWVLLTSCGPDRRVRAAHHVPVPQQEIASGDGGASQEGEVEELHDPGRGGDREEDEEEPDVPADGVRVDVHALVGSLAPRKFFGVDAVATDLGPAHRAGAVVQGAHSHHEHREGGEQERRAEDRADGDLARRVRVAAREGGRQDGDYGDHGLRQGGADGRENATHSPLPQSQASADDLDGVGENRSGDDDRDQSDRELETNRQTLSFLRSKPGQYILARDSNHILRTWPRTARNRPEQCPRAVPDVTQLARDPSNECTQFETG